MIDADSEIFLTGFSFFLGAWLKLTRNNSAFIKTKTDNILKKVTIRQSYLDIQRKITSFLIVSL